MVEPVTMFLAPDAGDELVVRLNAAMVRDLRAHHDDAPAATNHELADRVAQLLDAGTDELRVRCVSSAGAFVVLPAVGRVRVLAEYELVKVTCAELTSAPDAVVVFCAGDCDLQRVELAS